MVVAIEAPVFAHGGTFGGNDHVFAANFESLQAEFVGFRAEENGDAIT